MSFTVEKLEHSMAKLTITVPAADFDKAMTAAYNKTKNRFNVPGFRKGKVPMAFIEKMYGPEVFYEDAANAMINEYYPKEAVASELEIASQPVIDAESLGGDDAGAGGLCAGAGSGGDAYEMRLAGKIRAVVPADKVLVYRQGLVNEQACSLDDIHRAAAAHGEEAVYLIVDRKLADLKHAGVLTVGVGAGVRDELYALCGD